MALTTKSAFFYGLDVTTSNNALDFQVGATQYAATLNIGNYTATTLCTEIVRAMQAADINNTYSATYSRIYSAGTVVSKITISSSTTSFVLLFGSGARVLISCSSLLGFAAADTASGSTFTGTSSFGTTIQPTLVGYNYLPRQATQKVVGSLNVSASGVKEAVLFSVQQFFQVEFKYEPEAKTKTEWANFLYYASLQKLIEFAEDVTTPASTIDCTLEKTDFDGKGMGFQLKEMLPEFPFLYRTGSMQFRVRPTAASLI
jgi:hypothetical protein